MPSENKIMLVINPISGNVDKEELLVQMQERLRWYGYSFTIYKTAGTNDYAQLRQVLAEDTYDRMIACGGDGTIAFAAEVAAEYHLPLGIIPLGSSNGLAKCFQIPDIPLDALEVALKGVPIEVDAVDLNGSKSLHLSDLGLNAHLVMNFENGGLRGKVGYLKEVIRTISEHETFRVKIQTTTETVETEAVIVVIANAQMYGTGIVINPFGSVCDGKFEIVLSKRFDMIELTKLIAGGTNFDPEVVTVLSSDSASIEIVEGDIYFQVDGEYKGRVQQVTANIIPSYITILVPPQLLQDLT